MIKNYQSDKGIQARKGTASGLITISREKTRKRKNFPAMNKQNSTPSK